LRQQRKILPLTNASSQFSQVGSVMGAINIGLGMISAFLMIVSQYLHDSLLNTGIVWTPVLITVIIVQIACAISLIASRKLASNKGKKTRFQLRL
jgi:hypothetical protein